ncbi:hypothetical protein CAXC1_40002 [Candidatus Xenohaliotis californiensis]|uniref:Uncharacterized protein n=1 Tax=Candidatus Xenohaliotis californiensis TaxID=84677 RepID=A0ABM9N936_9RICK|nr:hypothetical protein CAXC1_40002 [Candidatus Xenohaliotis californiensis]
MILSMSANSYNDSMLYDNAISTFLSEINNKNSIKSQNIDELHYNKINETHQANSYTDTNNFFSDANLLVLNKMTAKTTKILAKNEQKIFEGLNIKLFGCWFVKDAPDDGHRALLKISYNDINNKNINLLNGWIFSKFYFLNNINNSIYDIKLISCAK